MRQKKTGGTDVAPASLETNLYSLPAESVFGLAVGISAAAFGAIGMILDGVDDASSMSAICLGTRASS